MVLPTQEFVPDLTKLYLKSPEENELLALKDKFPIQARGTIIKNK
jgi:hypothetical protein